MFVSGRCLETQPLWRLLNPVQDLTFPGSTRLQPGSASAQGLASFPFTLTLSGYFSGALAYCGKGLLLDPQLVQRTQASLSVPLDLQGHKNLSSNFIGWYMPLGPVWPLSPVSSGDSSFPVRFDLVLLRSWRDIFIWLFGLTLLEITRNRKSRPLLRAGWGEDWAWQGTEGERDVCAGHGVADAVIRAGAGGHVQHPGDSSRESLKSS